MKPRHLFIVSLLYGILLYSGEFIFPFAIAMGNDLGSSQPYQGANACPKVEIAPPMSPCDRIPSGYQGHDELPPILFAVAISFIVGFRIAAWMSRRQIDRLRRVWNR